jgi:hypothetical protein
MPTSRRRGSRRDERANERGRVGSSGKLGSDDTFLLPLALFSDEPLVAGTTRIGGIHIGELRQAIDAVRYAAGLLPAWTSYGALSGTIVAGPNNEARTKLDDAVYALLGHTVSYTGETPAGNGRIYAYQIQQIRDGVR